MTNVQFKVPLLLAIAVAFFWGHTESVAVAVQQNQGQDEFPLPDEDGQINLADKADLDLQGLVQWLAIVKDIKIVDDTGKTAGKMIKFYGRRPYRVSSEGMFELAQAVLRTKGLAIVHSEAKGWDYVVELSQARAFAPQGKPEQLQNFPGAEYVTAIFPLVNVSPEEASGYISDLIYSGSGSNDGNNQRGTMTSIASRKLLIVTETANKLLRINELIVELDQPIDKVHAEFYKVIHLEADQLSTQLTDILSQTTSTASLEVKTNQSSQSSRQSGLRINADTRTNRLILIGTTSQIEEALQIVKKLDVELDLVLERYQFQFVPAARIDGLITQSFGAQEEQAVKRVYQSSLNTDANQLIVTASEEIHQRIRRLKEQLDIPSQQENQESPVEFYTLKNVKAVDILDTLQSVERRFRENRFGRSRQNNLLTGISTRDGFQVNGPNNLNSGAEGPIAPTNFQTNPDPSSFGGAQLPPGFSGGGTQGAFPGGVANPGQLGFDPQSGQPFGGGGAAQSGSVIPGAARVTIDENTNTLIVFAEPAVQQLYADLIERLDVRRPQVLIEVHVVTLTDDDDFNLGIEIGGGDRSGGRRLFAFTSFGLSETDGAAGTLALTPGLGFNGTLVDPEIADVVLRALVSHGEARVVSAPRILVTDNATGILSSVAEVPFTSVNAANTVSTTSFAGFAQAGTTISVTPQISEDDYLNLEFDVLINVFTGTGAGGVPPPRNTDQVASEVSIPDGHTVIVGGLTRRNLAEDTTGIPLLDRLPIIKELTKQQTRNSDGQRLFVFIKPLILRDDKFQDLRFLSGLNRKKAQIADDFPSSSPILVR